MYDAEAEYLQLSNDRYVIDARFDNAEASYRFARWDVENLEKAMREVDMESDEKEREEVEGKKGDKKGKGKGKNRAE